MPLIYWHLFNGQHSAPLSPAQAWWFDIIYPCAATVLAFGWLYLLARILQRHFNQKKDR